MTHTIRKSALILGVSIWILLIMYTFVMTVMLFFTPVTSVPGDLLPYGFLVGFVILLTGFLGVGWRMQWFVKIY